MGGLTAPLHPKLFATEDVMQQVLHAKRTQAHQTLRRLLPYKDVKHFLMFTAQARLCMFTVVCKCAWFSYQSSAGYEPVQWPSLA